MRTQSANPYETTDKEARSVILLVYPGVTLLDVSGPSQVFGNAGDILPNGELGEGPIRFEVTLASKNGGIVQSDVGVALSTVAVSDLNEMKLDTLLVSGGIGALEALEDKELVAWFRQAAERSRRVGSTCMGAFFLAETGICEGQQMTTHWRWAEHLKKRYSSATVTPEQIFVRKDRFWSSAGVTSGIDMALAMVEEDLGHKVSIELAKAILVYFRRPGNQTQYSNRLQAQFRDEEGIFEELIDWIANNLQRDLTVIELAHKQGMSPRNFARVFAQKVGISPAKYVERARIDAAKSRLTETRSTIGAIARDVGFGCEKSFRRAFLRVNETTPNEYRQRYAASAS